MATLTVPRKSPKGERLVARISPDDKAIIAKAAAIVGQSVGGFVLTQARKAALDTLETHERILLNAAQSHQFVEALLAPPRPPSPALLEAARAYRSMVKSDLDQAVHPRTSRSTSSRMGMNSRLSSRARKPKRS